MIVSVMVITLQRSTVADCHTPVCCARSSCTMSGDACVQTHAWAVAARQLREYRRCEHQLAIDTLEELLAGSCDPDSAASRLAAPYATLLEQDVDEVGELWVMMCDAIKALGINIAVAECLTRLTIAISRLPDVTDNDGKAIECKHGFPGVYWRGLPGFAMVFREYAVGMCPVVNLCLVYTREHMHFTVTSCCRH